MGKKTRAGFLEAGSHNCQGCSVFKEMEPVVCTRDFSKKEELSGQLGIFGPLSQEAGMQVKVSPRDPDHRQSLVELGQTRNLSAWYLK